MSTDDILALLNEAATVRCVARLRSIVDPSVYHIADADILASVITVEVQS